MEWVETTGKTVEAAKELALDQLGVDESEAEFEVLEEPQGLLSRWLGQARVRARVRPRQPPPKAERRPRRRGGGGSGQPRRGSGGRGVGGGRGRSAPEKERSGGRREGLSASQRDSTTSRPRSEPSEESRRESASAARSGKEDQAMSEEISVEEQGEIVADFVEGLLEQIELDGTVSRETIDEDTVEVQVTGENLGLLIGPKGQTLSAIQELARTVVQREASGRRQGRVHLDIGGYRQRRRGALEEFAKSVAADVLEHGTSRALEPMGSADRKVVHDAVNEIEGVRTISEGEEPRRRVVIVLDNGS